MPILLNKTLRLFLDSIGRRDEYEYYLKRFASDHEGSFAIVCPERSGFEEAAVILAFDVDFLLRLGLDPLILLAGEDAEAMCDLLLAGDQTSFSARRFSATPAVAAEPVVGFLDTCRQAGKAAVVVCPEQSRDACLRELVPTVSTRIHFIRVRGPLHDSTGAPLTYHYVLRPDGVELAAEDRPLVRCAAELLEREPKLHVSVASPLSLLEELFTVKGAGCVIRMGASIHRHQGLDGIDRNRLVSLLEDSFGRRIASRSFLQDVSVAYLDGAYRGAALLIDHRDAMYLSKFAVGTYARGEGLAVELWRELARDHPAIFWRSRPGNPINQWYEKQADGYHGREPWRVFWRGISAERIPEVIAYATSRGDDFVAPQTE